MSNLARAALWMTGAILSFSSMAISGRWVSLDHDTFELMLYRSVVGLVIVVGFAVFTGRIRGIGHQHLPTHLLRNLAHFTGQNLWFYALTMIPMAQVFALEFTSPLWVILLAPVLLGEPLTRRGILAALIGFAGILLITSPGTAPISVGVLSAALAAIAFALTAILTRRLTRTVDTLTILFWLTGMQLIFGLIMAGWDGDIRPPTQAALPWLILIGCAGLLAHLCLTRALALAPASKVIPIDFTRLPLIAGIGALFYDEPVGFGLALGAALIVIGNIINLREKLTT